MCCRPEFMLKNMLYFWCWGIDTDDIRIYMRALLSYTFFFKINIDILALEMKSEEFGNYVIDLINLKSIGIESLFSNSLNL